jgi:hypothetical protein
MLAAPELAERNADRTSKLSQSILVHGLARLHAVSGANEDTGVRSEFVDAVAARDTAPDYARGKRLYGTNFPS